MSTAGSDLYRILRVSRYEKDETRGSHVLCIFVTLHTAHSHTNHNMIFSTYSTASTLEIKEAYRRLAMKLHPDRHEGCEQKLAAFKQVTEAYSILMEQRSQYDDQRRRDKRKRQVRDYRTIYRPTPPPEWKGKTWDHATHQSMHYGDGMMNEAIRDARRRAEASGEFTYQSPLGPGFSFEFDRSKSEDGQEESTTATNNHHDYNPYSKRSPQGPPKMVFEYEEGDNHADGRATVHRTTRIVQDMASRRTERIRHRREQQHRRMKNDASPQQEGSQIS